MSASEQLSSNLCGLDIEHGVMNIKNGTITCFMIVEHPHDLDFIRKTALSLVVAGCNNFIFYGQQESIWHLETDLPKSIIIMAQNKEEAIEKCKDEVRACTGERVMKAVPQRVSPLTNNEKKKLLADELEEFMFECNEYDRPDNSMIKWIISSDRYEVTDGIFKYILKNGTAELQQYVETELMFMHSEDQNKSIGKSILKLLKEI